MSPVADTGTSLVRTAAPVTLTVPAAGLSLRDGTRRPRRLGLLVMAVFLGGFLSWGAMAPIAGGSVAPGIISPDGNRRTVQHLEGGIIAELRVRDGDRVTAGQVLVVLESVQPRALYNALQHQFLTLLAMRARLVAEQAGDDRIALPPELEENSAETRAIVQGQQAMFDVRRAAHQDRRQVLRQRIEQSNEQIRGLEAQVRSAQEQAAIITDELNGKEHLLRLGLIPRPEVLRLRRSQAEIQGRWGEYTGMIARARQVIGEAETQMLSLDSDRLDRIAEQLDRVRVELAGVTERFHASRDVLARTVVSAPIAGRVVNLRFMTVEGVIRAGEPILDIVPDEERLLIDARVPPFDIDVVTPGLVAQIRLTAYSSRGLLPIQGVVRTVSADRIVDPQTTQTYYLARVEVTREELDRLGPGISLVPGMPAEVLIVRRERTLLRYLIEPLWDAYRRSFREV